MEAAGTEEDLIAAAVAAPGAASLAAETKGEAGEEGLDGDVAAASVSGELNAKLLFLFSRTKEKSAKDLILV